MSNFIEWRSQRAAAVLTALMCLCGSAAAESPHVPDVTKPPAASEANGSSRYFRVTFATGLDFSTGDFGTDTDADTWYVPTSLKLEWDPFFLKVTVPYVIVDGDVVLSGGYVYFPTSPFLPVVELSGKVKFATADEDKGLGTGEENYSLQLDVSKQFGWFTPFGAVGYKFIGDPPGVDLNDKIFASAGFSARLSDRVSAGVVYDWAESAVAGRSDIHEISPFGSIRFGNHFSIDPYALVGLTSASPDWGVGVLFRTFWDND